MTPSRTGNGYINAVFIDVSTTVDLFLCGIAYIAALFALTTMQTLYEFI